VAALTQVIVENPMRDSGAFPYSPPRRGSLLLIQAALVKVDLAVGDATGPEQEDEDPIFMERVPSGLEFQNNTRPVVNGIAQLAVDRICPKASGVTMTNLQAPTSGPGATQMRLRNDLLKGMLGAAFFTIERWALSELTLLITGEPGTGKELLAQAIHQRSARAAGNLLSINCGILSEARLGLELFGHASGVLSEGTQPRTGRVQQAQGGTLFLDEIAQLPLSLQVKLLRLLQYQEFSAMDDGRILSADVRIIAATSVPLDVAVQTGAFREDLGAWLKRSSVHCPALRDRPAEVGALAQHYFVTARRRLDRQDLTGISSTASRLLCGHVWPGNLRELEDVMAQAVLSARGPEVMPQDLPDQVKDVPRPSHASSRAQVVGRVAR